MTRWLTLCANSQNQQIVVQRLHLSVDSHHRSINGWFVYGTQEKGCNNRLDSSVLFIRVMLFNVSLH